MKKTVILVMLLTVSVMMSAKADQPLHRFLNERSAKTATHPGLSVSEYKVALRALFTHDREDRYWNNLAVCSYDQMREMYRLHLQQRFNLPQPPTDAAMAALVDISSAVPAPSTVRTAGIEKGTGVVVKYTRPANPGEMVLAKDGIGWTLVDCGNLNGDDFGSPKPVFTGGEEELDMPIRPKVQFASTRDRDDDNINVRQNQNVSSGIDPTVLALLMQKNNSGSDDFMKQYLMMDMMTRSRVAEPVRQRANAWEVIAGMTGIVNVGLNVWDIALDSKNSRRYYPQQTQQYRVMPPVTPQWTGNNSGGNYGNDRDRDWSPRPRTPDYGGRYHGWNPRQPTRPNRPDYDNGTWYERPRQPRGDVDYNGASGDYRLNTAYRYDNTNASGLGAGSYNDSYYDRRNNPLQDNGRGNATDTRTGREYTYDQNHTW